MCGIAGILGEIGPDDREAAARMVELMHYRGPDGDGLVELPGALLGHRRLSIIDLSERGKQPMATQDGRYVITFNGEIYNYKELRRELKPSHTFLSDSDTEVLLAGYQQWGEDVLERLQGMFAFCIYDTLNRSAFLARDRFGQKPLLFHEQSNRLIFASEAKAILCAGLPARPDMAAWHSYLTRAQYDHSDRTFFDGIRQLRPGECARWQKGGSLEIRQYYDLAERIEARTISDAAAASEIRHLMTESARLHMRSDVPVGVSLSGGLDSSALLACFHDADTLHAGVKAISANFGASYSEAEWVDRACSYFGLKAHSFEFTVQEFHDYIKPMMWHLEGPLGGLMNCALTKVMKVAREDGITVLQDGSGIDEAFGGYQSHHDLYLADLINRDDSEAATAIRDYAVNWSVSESDAVAAARRTVSGQPTAIDGTPMTRDNLVHPDLEKYAETLPAPSSGKLDPLHVGLVDFLQNSKIPRNTRMKDRSSMAYGIELRIPFLDHHLVEAALGLPSKLLYQHGRSKSIVRDALKGVLDDDVRLATKRSVHAPQGSWLGAEPMRSYVRDLIHSESFADRGLFAPRQVKQAFENFLEQGASNSFFIWQWINTEEWFRTFIDKNAVTDRLPLCPQLSSKTA